MHATLAVIGARELTAEAEETLLKYTRVPQQHMNDECRRLLAQVDRMRKFAKWSKKTTLSTMTTEVKTFLGTSPAMRFILQQMATTKGKQ